MALTVSNNGAVAAASYYLGKNQDALQTSIKRLASGKKIVGGAQDPGTLAVSMKVNAAINRLSGAQNNIRNAQGFLEVQDGLLETAGKIVMRMSELKGYASQDPLKGEQDIASYDNEFKDLQIQLHAISQLDFNGTSLFAQFVSDGQGGSGTDEMQFNASSTLESLDHTLDIYTSTKGSEGSKVSIHKSSFLSALTILGDKTSNLKWSERDNDTINNGTTLATATQKIALAAESAGETLKLSNVSSGIFEKALENVVYLRAQRRIEDVDIAAEAANLSKYSILMQASAAMVAQANSQNDVALMLLR